jgi:hypothetical protein
MKTIIIILAFILTGCAPNYDCSESMDGVISANGYPSDILAHDEGTLHQRSYYYDCKGKLYIFSWDEDEIACKVDEQGYQADDCE